MSDCSKCSKSSKDEMLHCDSCKRFLCEGCSELSATEMRCMQLKIRKLLFLCEACKNGLGEVPVLIKAVSEIKKEVLKLQGSSLTRQNNPSKDMENNHDIINEIEERSKRRKNVIIANIKESEKVNGHERKIDDKNTVINILSPIGITMDRIKVFRLGKFNKENNRLIKIIFETEDDAITILKNKNKIKVPRLRIFNDQTKMQIDYYKKLKGKLQAMQDNGDMNKGIKYINGRPTIVSTTDHQPIKN
jgi:hypothetical protein